MTVKWQGDTIKRKMERRARDAINATMSDAVLHARRNHGPGAHSQDRFETQTSALEGSINITQPARLVRGGVAGRWGSQDIAYALRIELGFQGKDSLGRVIDQQAFPFLRPAARSEYPKLGNRLRGTFR